MAHNVKVKYYARENTKMKPHSFYAQVIPNGTYGFERVCEEAARNTTIEAHTIRAAVEEYMKVAQARICDGFRVEIGPQFITLAPGLTAKVKDELNDDGTVKKACTADDLKATGARSRVTATVNPDFTYKVSNSIKWQKTDAKGNAIENEEEDATLDDDSEENQNINNGEGGGNQSNNGGSSEAIAAPTISGNTTFTESAQVSMAADDGAEIRYTTDGSTPTASSTLYGEPFTVTETTSVKAIAIKNGQTSSVASKTFVKSSGEGGMDQN